MNLKEVKALIDQLSKAEHAYYVLNNPIMSDGEYDNLTVQTRYNSEDLNCKIKKISDNELLVELIEPASSIAPGQFGVLFSGTKVIGGGRISSKLMESA